MNVSTQLLDYNALVICTYNLTNKCDNYLWDLNYWSCYYGNKVIHNSCNKGMGICLICSCNMCICDLQYTSDKSPMPMLQSLHNGSEGRQTKSESVFHRPQAAPHAIP